MSLYIRRHSGFLVNKFLINKQKSSLKLLTLADNIIYKSQRTFQTTSQLNKIVAFNLSDIGEGIREVTVKEWFVKVGDTVEQFDNICEVQSDKASVTITSRYDGKISKLLHAIDEIALVGKPLVEFDVAEEDDSNSSSSSSDDENETITSSSDNSSTEESSLSKIKVLATPAVRRIAGENKVDLSKVPATGRQGRVLKGDVLEYLNLVPAGTNVPHPTLLKSASTTSVKPLAADRVEKIKGVRKIMLKTMTESLKIPHFNYSDEIDVTNLLKIRESLKTEAEARGSKLTFMPFFIKAASLALFKYPILNSSLDEPNESIIYKSSHNISVAIASPDGLVVPNIKNCEQKTIFDIAVDLNLLQQKAQKGQLTPSDYANGTFSLSNIGIVGGTYTHPVVLTPQVAIGGLGKIRPVPRFGPNDELQKVHILTVSWAADHRVIDGVTMANFSNVWKNYLENPNLFLLDG